MSGDGPAGATALVTGASRGLGRGIATALCGAGAQVVGVARDRAPLEAARAGLGVTFTAVLPRITPLTDLGGPAVRAYAARAGQSEEAYLQPLGEPLTPEQAGKAITDLVSGPDPDQDAYLLTAAGLRPLP